MAKVKIYKVKLYDVTTDQVRVSRRMATRGGAATMGGEILEKTEIEIDEAGLERDQEWTPMDFEP